MHNTSYIRNTLLVLTSLLLCFLQTSCGIDVSHINTSSRHLLSPSPPPQKEQYELDDEIEEMIDAIRLPAYMTTLEEYKSRAKIADKNLPIIKKWLKDIFIGKVNIKTQRKLTDLESGSGVMNVSPLLSVLPYKVNILLIQELVKKGADVNKKEQITDQRKVSPLGYSFAFASPPVTSWLLEKKADLKVKHHNDRPVAFLLLALLKENPWPAPKYELATSFVQKLNNTKKMSQVDENGNTVLHDLVLVNEDASTKVLLRLLRDRYPDFIDCLYVANRKNRTPLELMLLEKDPDYSKSGMIVSLFDLMNKDFFREEAARLDEEDEKEQYGWRIVKMVSNSDGKSTPDRAFFLKQIAHEVSKKAK